MNWQPLVLTQAIAKIFCLVNLPWPVAHERTTAGVVTSGTKVMAAVGEFLVSLAADASRSFDIDAPWEDLDKAEVECKSSLSSVYGSSIVSLLIPVSARLVTYSTCGTRQSHLCTSPRNRHLLVVSGAQIRSAIGRRLHVRPPGSIFLCATANIDEGQRVRQIGGHVPYSVFSVEVNSVRV